MSKLDFLDAKIRPLPATEKTSLSVAARVYINKDSLIALTGSLENGKLCYLEPRADCAEPRRREATLWILLEKNISPNVVLVTRAFQEACGFKVGDQVRLTVAGPVPPAHQIVVRTVDGGSTLDPRVLLGWKFALESHMERAGDIFPGLTFEGVMLGRLRASFQVTRVNGQTANLARFSAASSEICILTADDSNDASAPQASDPQNAASDGHLQLAPAAGLSRQITDINKFLAGFSSPFLFNVGLRTCGFVIYGGHGTGKTFLLERLAASGWGPVFRIAPTEKSTGVRDAFKQARAQRPSIVLIDRLDELLQRDRPNCALVVDVLCQELDLLAAEAAATGELPKVVVAAACIDYLTDVPQALKAATRFRRRILLPIPSATERLEILTAAQLPLKPELKDKCLADIARQTHAYNPGDLINMVQEAVSVAETRLGATQQPDENTQEPATFMSMQDLQQAIRIVRPTAMKDINLKPPTVQWGDVGGQDLVKKSLQWLIKLTMNTNPELRRVIKDLPTGVLMYGPPGCSKTLSAQAMATESGFNFFSVKGPELLNMYVGESERAIRQLFERARAATPSIIFFDEIDAIGGQRTGASSSGSGGGGGSRSSASLNIVTTLLTEMDGFETLSGVLVIAATNRPDAIDPALLRPGRLGKCLYVGPPDAAARADVFRFHLRSLALAPDVDVAALAAPAHGYSGADIKEICSAAGTLVGERYLDALAAGGGSSELLQITQADLLHVMAHTPRSITDDMVRAYERWQKKFRPMMAAGTEKEAS